MRLRLTSAGEDPKEEIDRRVAAHCKHHKVNPLEIEGKLFVDDRETYPITFGTEKNQVLAFDEAHLAVFETRIKEYGVDVSILGPLISFYANREAPQ
jgi:hypothetical protein